MTIGLPGEEIFMEPFCLFMGRKKNHLICFWDLLTFLAWAVWLRQLHIPLRWCGSFPMRLCRFTRGEAGGSSSGVSVTPPIHFRFQVVGFTNTASYRGIDRHWQGMHLADVVETELKGFIHHPPSYYTYSSCPTRSYVINMFLNDIWKEWALCDDFIWWSRHYACGSLCLEEKCATVHLEFQLQEWNKIGWQSWDY